MKKRISVMTEDDFLFQKIYLMLRNKADVCRGDDEAEICLWDKDTLGEAPFGSYSMSREGGDITIPFCEGDLNDLIFVENGRVKLTLGEGCAYLRGRKIRLTDVEFKLLSRLILASGEFVCRDELVRDVWGEGVDFGILNVYIHYLREKLEAGADKIILSSRNRGYKIDERFIFAEEDIC